MENNFKNLKFYKWLTNISPLMFELKMKLECDYNFFNRAAHSLNFPEAYWLEIENEILNIHKETRPGLDLYANLPFHGETEVFFQLMLKLSIFHWKFLPAMLVDLFKGYPLVGPETIPFSDLEVSLFDAWLELPLCIDELYTIMLEKGWRHTMQRDNSWTYDPYGNFDVFSHNAFSQHFDWVIQYLKRNHLPLNNSNIGGLYVLALRKIPTILELAAYWIKVKKGHSNLFIDSFVDMTLQKISLFTSQLLLVNPFFDFSPERERYDKQEKAYTDEEKVSMLKYYHFLNIEKQNRPYKSYEEWYTDWTTGFGPYFNYPGDVSKNDSFMRQIKIFIKK